MSDERVAIVTGASSGIGRAVAVEFAKAGYSLVIAARHSEKLEQVASDCRSAGTEVVISVTDVSDPQQVQAMVDSAVERFGRVDVLVNNAGFGVHARVHETTESDMRDIFDVNYYGVFYGCKAVAPIMMRQKSGHIFNVSSVIGKRGCPFNGAYSATKFAVCGLTEAMRVEMMPYKVRLTSVCPGLTDTDFFREVRGGTAMKRSSFAKARGLKSPVTVARKIVRSVGKNRPEMYFSLGDRILIFVNNRWPRLADRMMKLYHDDLAREK